MRCSRLRACGSPGQASACDGCIAAHCASLRLPPRSRCQRVARLSLAPYAIDPSPRGSEWHPPDGWKVRCWSDSDQSGCRMRLVLSSDRFARIRRASVN